MNFSSMVVNLQNLLQSPLLITIAWTASIQIIVCMVILLVQVIFRSLSQLSLIITQSLALQRLQVLCFSWLSDQSKSE